MKDNKNLPNVHLRAIEPEDLDTLYMVENNTELWSVGSTNVPYSRYTLHDYVANSSNDIYSDKQVRMIVSDDENATTGIVDLVNFNPQHQRAELGIVILKHMRGKGYAKAAIKSIMSYALTILHLHQLYVIVDVNNTVSINLFLDMGFEKNTELKDWLYDGRDYHNAAVMQTFL